MKPTKETAKYLLQTFTKGKGSVIERHLNDIWLMTPKIPNGLKGSYINIRLWEIKRDKDTGEILDYTNYSGEIFL